MARRPAPHPGPPGATLHLGGDAWAHPDLEADLVPIADVEPWPGNPRRGDQDAITASIRDHGLYAGVVVQEDTGRIVVGNHRRHALIELGATRIPRKRVGVDDTRAAAIVARDNRTSDLGGFDYADLVTLLTDDPDVLALSGYLAEDVEDMQRMLDNLAFVEEAGEALDGEDVTDVTPPIDVDGDIERVTVTVDAGKRPDLYAILAKQPWVRNVEDAHTRKPAPAS